MKLSVAIIGGGISGLTAAYYLNRFGLSLVDKILLFEKSSHLGGQVRSTRFPDGTVYEYGPRTVRPKGPSGAATLQLIDDLGLNKYILSIKRGHPSSKNRLILVNDKLVPLPTGFLSFFRTKPPFSRPLGLAVLQDMFTDRIVAEDDSMYNFACRRFGLEVADYAIDPLCRGTVAGDAKEISVKTILKPFFEAEQKHGSIVKGMMSNLFGFPNRPFKDYGLENTCSLYKKAKKEGWKMWSIREGMQVLPDTLTNVLKDAGVKLHVNSACEKITFFEDKVRLRVNGKNVDVDHVFASLPAKNMSPLLQEDHPKLAKAMNDINSVSVAIVNLEYPGQLLNHKAFGFLVPSNQKCDILGTIFDSCNFPEHNGQQNIKTRLTVMMGGRWFEHLFGNPTKVDHDMLLSVASHTVQSKLGMPSQASRQQVLILQDCIPQYTVGHSERLQYIQKYISDNELPLTLLGASYEGVSVNDCIYNSRTSVVEWLDLMERALGENPNLLRHDVYRQSE